MKNKSIVNLAQAALQACDISPAPDLSPPNFDVNLTACDRLLADVADKTIHDMRKKLEEIFGFSLSSS